MDIGALTATLGVDSSGLRKAEGDLRSFGSSAESTLGRVGNAANSCASQLATIAGVTLSLVGAFAVAEKAMSSWYSLIKSGIGQVEELKKTVIGASYILTTMSDVKPVNLDKTYAAWKDYFNWLHRASMEADKRAAASAQEIFTVGVELRKKGVSIVSKEDVDTMGRLTDLMKAVTPAYASLTNQVRGEVEAMMSGANRMGAQTAMVLGQIDPLFKENIANARKMGTEMEYFRSLLPSIRQYTLDMMGTWDAVSSSMQSAWSVVQVKAFGDAHREVVSMVSQLTEKLMQNGELTVEGALLAEELRKAWDKAREAITYAVDYMIQNFPKIVSDVGSIASGLGTVASAAFRAAVGAAELVGELRKVSQDPVLMTILGAALGSRAGAIGAAVGGFAGLAASQQMKNYSEVEKGLARQQAAAGIGSSGEAAESYYPLPAAGALGAAPPTPKTRPPGEKPGKGGGGGGGGAEAEINRLNSLFDTLTKDIARLSEGKLSAIEADYVKTVENIYKKTSDRAHSEAEVEILAKQRATLQKEKLQDEFDMKMAKGSGDAFIELKEQYDKDLLDYNGLAGAKEKLDAYYGRQRTIKEVERATEVMNLEKQTIDAMAGLMPMLRDQLPLKRRSLEIENELAQAAITKLMAEKPYLAHLEDELRLRQAILAQAKKYNLEMDNDQGIRGWAYGRSKEADQRNTIKDMMGGLESGFQNAFSSGLQGVLQGGNKKTLKEIGKTMFEGLIGELHKGATTKLFDSAAKMFRPEPPGGVGGVAGDLGDAAKGLQTASAGFNTNTAQFGLAAGGLLLSGIGIATNSQALVYAGAVLQIAGLAIQLYEALTATTTVASMTVAAGALTGSAGALTMAASSLMMAAAVDAIPFFHSGGVITAHGGWPRLKSDEVPIIAQTGERVLSRVENKSYEAGMRAGGKGGSSINFAPVINNPADARGMGKELERQGRSFVKMLRKEASLGRKF